MKTKLLLLFVLFAQLTIAQNLVISEIFVNPSGSDSPFEYIELRGDPGATIAADTYLIQVEGDSNDPGDVESNGDASNGCTVNNDGSTPCPQGGIIDLSGVTIGSNGYVVILTTGHDYTVHPDATVLLDVTDGDLEGQSHSFLLVNTNGNGAPSSSDDIDDDDDGEIDMAYTSIWTFLDGVSFIDDDDATEYAYGNVIYAESAAVATLLHPATSTVISTDTQYDYAARIGNSTGSTANNDAGVDAVDWMGGDVPSNTSSPRVWVMGSNSSAVRTHPESWEGSELNHIGSANPGMNTLSTEDLSRTIVGLFPNPASSEINLSTNIHISSVEVFNVIGKKVISIANLNDNKIDVSNLTNGIYILRISSGNSSITKKFVKN